MKAERVAELRAIHENSLSLSYGEVAEIQEAFDALDHATLCESPENASILDMLDEIEAATR